MSGGRHQELLEVLQRAIGIASEGEHMGEQFFCNKCRSLENTLPKLIGRMRDCLDSDLDEGVVSDFERSFDDIESKLEDFDPDSHDRFYEAYKSVGPYIHATLSRLEHMYSYKLRG